MSVLGPLSQDVVEKVFTRILHFIDDEFDSVILDLTDQGSLDGVSESQLGVLIAYMEEIRDRGGNLKLIVGDRLNNVLDLLGFPLLFDILSSDTANELLRSAEDYEEEPFPIRFRFVEGIAVITIDEVLDDEVAHLTRSAFEKLVERKRYRIVVDAPRLENTCGDGLKTFLSALDDLQDAGGIVKVVAAEGKLSEALDLLGFSMFASVDEAIDSYLSGDDQD